MPPQGARALTAAFNGIALVLRSPVKIQQGFEPTLSKLPPPTKDYNAVWDTGATRTAITHEVAIECGLKPTGMCKVKTASGEHNTCTYFVSLYLPNHVCFPQLRVTEAVLSGADVLIGMDVITGGDFAVTNSGGKTVLSFRMPSIECIDFVKQAQPKQAGPNPLHWVGRNSPCPCGSGKKYKKCCGK